jgi:hypothetical protein
MEEENRTASSFICGQLNSRFAPCRSLRARIESAFGEGWNPLLRKSIYKYFRCDANRECDTPQTSGMAIHGGDVGQFMMEARM